MAERVKEITPGAFFVPVDTSYTEVKYQSSPGIVPLTPSPGEVKFDLKDATKTKLHPPRTK